MKFRVFKNNKGTFNIQHKRTFWPFWTFFTVEIPPKDRVRGSGHFYKRAEGTRDEMVEIINAEIDQGPEKEVFHASKG